MSAAVLISFAEVARWYGEIIALNGVSFTLEPGVTGLLGPNGAGKTTILRLITGQLRPSLGRVSVFGLDPFQSPEVFRRLGYCPDGDALYDEMTGFEFLELAGRLAGFDASEARRRADRALERMALTADAARRCGGYSKGMRQRLRLAQALIHEPEVLILDEPMSGLDPVGRHRIVELVRSWGESGGTVLVSSHILHEIEAMTKRILLVQGGRIRAEGDVREIRDLMDQKPHRVAIRCADPRRVAASLMGLAYVDSVALGDKGVGVLVETRKPDEFFAFLPQHLLDLGVEVDEVSAVDASLSAVFGYLTRPGDAA